MKFDEEPDRQDRAVGTLYPGEPKTGWVAVSEQIRAFYCAGYSWLDAYQPIARIGSSI